MADSPNLGITLLVNDQFNAETTLNEGTLKLDALVYGSIKDRDLDDPPTSPSDGDSYLIATGGTGTDWAGNDGDFTYWDGSSWIFKTPWEGMILWVQDENKLRRKYVKRFMKVLPAKKVLRYYQIENKLDAMIDMDLAAMIPLAR